MAPTTCCGAVAGLRTLLNTDLKRELDQLGRFLNRGRAQHKIGLGHHLIGPKPAEPPSTNYDYDVATVHGFLKNLRARGEIKVNIEQNHALLARPTSSTRSPGAGAGRVRLDRHEPRRRAARRWDTDQFPNNLPQMALAMYHIVRGGNLGSGLNFDAKLRRQSIDRTTLIEATPPRWTCARALLVAEDDRGRGALERFVEEQYAVGRQSLAAPSCRASGRWRTSPRSST